MISSVDSCDGCVRRGEECIPCPAITSTSSKIKCQRCRMRKVACIFSTDYPTSTQRPRRQTNPVNYQIPDIDHDIELMSDFVNTPPDVKPHRSVAVMPARITTTKMLRLMIPTCRPQTSDRSGRERELNSEEYWTQQEEELNRLDEDYSRPKKEEGKQMIVKQATQRGEEQNADRLTRKRGEEDLRRTEEEIRRREAASRTRADEDEARNRIVEDRRADLIDQDPEEETTRSSNEESRRSGMMTDEDRNKRNGEKEKRIETDDQRLNRDLGEGGSLITRKRRFEAEWEGFKPKPSKKIRTANIEARFDAFHSAQLAMFRKLGELIDEDDFQEFKGLVDHSNENLELLLRNVKEC
ncbi:hypothetical protein Pst134EA_023014 [Puccinia striiformis f. sp. tritici]|uniref:hypothetical protein n=1 Tax=Puccinia striiformis f. sp. tritici TaxID=168172 RepID=UPI002007D884|nr:hypothetical protein Pst134EA_023014 [Puccinia striiformis f. sp. tritici]KAH9455555.1 hypothetical protein Pst134EA_023014 [Puccinia striiformis f. sp. tritici]